MPGSRPGCTRVQLRFGFTVYPLDSGPSWPEQRTSTGTRYGSGGLCVRSGGAARRVTGAGLGGLATQLVEVPRVAYPARHANSAYLYMPEHVLAARRGRPCTRPQGQGQGALKVGLRRGDVG